MELTSITLKNFRTHRNASFDFSTGVTAIIGGNGSGKSSIVEAILFLLTGEGYGKTKTEMLTVGQTSGWVIGKLRIHDKEAVLERHIDTAKVNFSYDGKVYKKSSEVNEIWDNLFQIDKNIVHNVIVSNQGEIALLFNGDNAAKEKLFQKIFMVPNTTKLRDVIWNGYIKDAPPEYPVKDTVQLTSDIQCLEKLIALNSEELKNHNFNNEEYEQFVARKAYLAKVEESFDKQIQLATQLEKVAAANKTASDAADSLRSKMKLINIQDYRSCLAEQKAQKALFDTRNTWLHKRSSLKAPTVEVDRSTIQTLQQKELELEAELKAKRTAVAELNQKIAEYETSGLATGICPTCGTKVENIAKLIEHVEKERAPIIVKGKAQKEELLKVQEELKKNTAHLEAWEKYEKELATINTSLEAYKDVNFDSEAYALCESVVSKHDSWELKLSELSKEENQTSHTLHALKLEAAGLTRYDRENDNFASEKTEVAAKIAHFQQAREDAKKLEIEIATNKRELLSLQQDMKDNTSYVDKNNKRKEYLGVLKGVYDLFHTGKFPRSLIQTYSSTVTEYMRDVLESFDFPYTAKVNDTFGIDIFNEDGLQLPAISGGQQVIVGFSLRLALHNMFVGAFPFMIIDEGSYGLTNENAKKYFEIIKTLGKSNKFKQVIVIDHHEELSGYVDNTIQL